jgi:hypothetical protein
MREGEQGQDELGANSSLKMPALTCCPVSEPQTGQADAKEAQTSTTAAMTGGKSVAISSDAQPPEHGETWQQVQRLLREHGEAQRRALATPSGAMLRGLLHCASCGGHMTPTHARGREGKRYDYYTCVHAIHHGRRTCTAPRLRAREIEQFVWQQLLEMAEQPVGHRDHERMEYGAMSLPKPTTPPAEQAAILREQVQRVDYDGAHAKVIVTLRQQPIEPSFKGKKPEVEPCRRRR